MFYVQTLVMKKKRLYIKQLLLLSLWLIGSMPLYAQERADELHHEFNVPQNLFDADLKKLIWSNGPSYAPNLLLPKTAPQKLYAPHFVLHAPVRPYWVDPSPRFKGDYHTQGALWGRSNRLLMGMGSQTSIPGLGTMNNASLLYQHAFNNRLLLQFSLGVNKMTMPHVSAWSLSADGMLSYQLSDRVALKAFGGYTTGYRPGMNSYQFGGAFSLSVTDRWGFDLGAQSYYNPMRRSWEVIPVVAPYFQLKKSKIQLDLGPILYELFRDAFQHSDRNSGPTIMPDRPSMPRR